MKRQIIDQVIAREGGYVNSPDDSGGKTRYGITERAARAWGYDGPVHDLPRDIAVRIYEDAYWPPALDDLLALSPRLAAEMFDTGVNMGPRRAVRFLQRALNVLNRQERDFGDIAVDGILGPVTVDAVTAFLRLRRGRGETALLTAVNCLQGASYIQLAERRKKDEAHLFGWLAHRIVLT